LGQRTWIRLPDWQSTADLFGSAVARDPDYREGHYLLAVDEFDRGLYAEAATRMQPLLEGGSDDKTSYLNPLSSFELACASYLNVRDFESVLALDRLAAKQRSSARRVATFRTCVGQAKGALGDTETSQQIYLSVAKELGASAPPRLSVMIARNWIKLGQAAEARKALQTARRTVKGVPDLEAQVGRLTVPGCFGWPDPTQSHWHRSRARPLSDNLGVATSRSARSRPRAGPTQRSARGVASDRRGRRVHPHRSPLGHCSESRDSCRRH
jgi:hypothetical protein